MSELGLGPEEVSQNSEKRVSYVSLRGRHLDDVVFHHLASFKYLNTLNVVDTNLSDDFVPLLLKIQTLRWLWVGGTDLTYDAAMHLERTISGLMVFQRGEGAMKDKPGGPWVKIGGGVWPKPKRKSWWTFFKDRT